MKCISDAASGTIERLSDRDAAWYVSDKPLRYAYVNKAAYKQQKAYEAQPVPFKRVVKSRRRRAKS